MNNMSSRSMEMIEHSRDRSSTTWTMEQQHYWRWRRTIGSPPSLGGGGRLGRETERGRDEQGSVPEEEKLGRRHFALLLVVF